METHIKSVVIRGSFETVVQELKDALAREGFVLCGVADFQKDFLSLLNIHFGKYAVISAHVPQLSYQLLSVAHSGAVVLPCSIAVIEHQPGEVEVIPVDSGGPMVRKEEDASFDNLFMEVRRKMESAVYSLYRDTTKTPDMITSWE